MSRSKWSKSATNGSYSGAFIGHLFEMLNSPAYKVLSRAARQVLTRIEIEYGNHGGTVNGDLIVTHLQFVEYGIHNNSVGPAIRELVALGFIEITKAGCAGNAGENMPNHFRLTYRPAVGYPADGSHDWRRCKTVEEAERKQKEARETPHENTLRRGGNRVKKQNPSRGFRSAPLAETTSPPLAETTSGKPRKASKL